MTLTPEQNPDPLFPEDLLEGDRPGETWWVAHTKSRREKALVQVLASAGAGYFLPLVRKRQPSRQRERYSLMPIFPGYLFFTGGPAQRTAAFATNHVVRILDVKDPEELRKELRQIHKALAADIPVYSALFLKEGQRVRIKTGPMEGLEGIIARKGREQRIVLTVSSINQAIAVNIEMDMVEPL